MTASRARISRSWSKLRTIEIAAPSDQETLQRLARQLASDGEVSQADRREAALYLLRLANDPGALRELSRAGRGRPTNPYAHDVALDYLVRKELLGKAAAAATAVSEAWSISVGTVKDCYGDWKVNAKSRLAQLIDHRVGQLRVGSRQPDGKNREHFWTRRQLLEAVRDGLQDHRKANRAAAKSGRRK